MTAGQAVAAPAEGFVDLDGEGFYVIADVDRLPPFLMSIVSPADHWMFVSSCGALTAGRRDATLALFPYETEDRLHRACGTTGPVTALRVGAGASAIRWEPWRGPRAPGCRRHLYKSVAGHQVIYEEVNEALGLAFRYRWSTSERFGFVRTATLANASDGALPVELLDGLVDVLPFGLEPSLYQRMSNLTNAYKRAEVVDPETGLAVFSLEARIVDRAEPSEALAATVAWSRGLPAADVILDPAALDAFRAGGRPGPGELVVGRPAAYLLSGSVELEPGEAHTWTIVGDVGQDQIDVAALRRYLRTAADPAADVAASVDGGAEALVAMMAAADGLQRTGDRMATAHQFANVTYNVMRGGVFRDGYRIDTADFAAFVAGRNHTAARDHAAWLAGLPEEVDRRDLLAMAQEEDDAHLVRLALEYLPLTFGRRHGDPSRPWNAFSIRTRDEDGAPAIAYEGNWRDIFQNWEALSLAFPEYLPGIVTVFVNASTPDGFNPYRITRDGIDWETPDPDDPWSNIGYWGDHQIVYLLRLLEATERFLPGELEAMLDRAWFTYADVPYRIVPYGEIVRDPKATIRYDEAAAERAAARVAEQGGDGRLVWDTERAVHLVTLLEKLVVPALGKLSNYVPGGGIWMNTQRPEWNDANNALVGYGASMVTLCHLRPYLRRLVTLAAGSGLSAITMSVEVADWLEAVTAVLRGNPAGGEAEPTAKRRKQIMDELGWAFYEYRSRVYSSGFSGTVVVPVAAIVDLCEAALPHVEDTIRRNRRPDGLYHSYNLVDFGADGSVAELHRLSEMLEGQVAVLSSGVLPAEERANVVAALFDSAMYRADQKSFMLYPARRLPSFLNKNVVPPSLVEANPLLGALVAAGDRTVIEVDADGQHRFSPAFRNAADLAAALDRLAQRDDRVDEARAATLDAYEAVLRHREFTGRSGSMYGYEGIGSIYWHMVGKLLVAVQEALVEAHDGGAAPATVDRLRDAYWRVRAGLGFNKTAAEYGAFPMDPYSHTPAHAGAQQPGMTGQVKEELLTRLLEVGIRIADGQIAFDPLLLRDEELLVEAEAWEVVALDGTRATVEVPARSLGLTVCQVPVVVSATAGPAAVEVTLADGTRKPIPGRALDADTSQAIFARTGQIAHVHAYVPR